MKLKVLIPLAVFSFLPLAAQAGDDAAGLAGMMQPGLWEMTTQMQMPGMPYQMPTQTFRRCITQADLDKYHGVPKPETHGDMTCTMQKFDRTGNTLSYTMKCTGKSGDMQFEGSTIMDSPDAYHGTMHMTGTADGHPMDMMGQTAGKRVGDCQ